MPYSTWTNGNFFSVFTVDISTAFGVPQSSIVILAAEVLIAYSGSSSSVSSEASTASDFEMNIMVTYSIDVSKTTYSTADVLLAVIEVEVETPRSRLYQGSVTKYTEPAGFSFTIPGNSGQTSGASPLGVHLVSALLSWSVIAAALML
ncbi:hypothetical protein Pelo_11847 [Pelomyxa schiedti]|nr:hypothetical protein Pelo_11847 [Pelomyxa schiedti]